MNVAAATAVTDMTGGERRGPTFPGAVRSELLKIRRQTMAWVLVALFALAAVGVAVSFVASGRWTDLISSHADRFYFTYLSAVQIIFCTFAGIFLLVTTSRLVSMEYGSGTIRVVLARGTPRLQLLAAQMVASAICGLLLLIAFAAVAAGFLYLFVLARHGSFSPITSLPSVAWRDTWINVLVCLISVAVCILLATATSSVGRSLAFGMGAALAFFPADNFAVIVMALMQRITHQSFWAQVTQWLLGPNLNYLPQALQPDHSAGSAFFPPLVANLSATHCLGVIGAYAAGFLALSLVLSARRDVLE